MNKLYKKELLYTIVFTALLLLTGHSATLFVLFGAYEGTLWGFPVYYIVPILLGWFGVTAVSYVMAIYCNRLDDELDAYTSQYNETAAAKEGKK